MSVEPTIHIFKLSQLVHARPSDWNKMLNDMAREEIFFSTYYKPVRRAAIKLTRDGISRRDHVLAQLLEEAMTVPCSPKQSPVKDNERAFHEFEQHFLPKISKFERSFVQVAASKKVVLGGVELKGLPHMQVEDTKGRTRYVYLHPSSWDKDKLHAYLQLLTIVVEAEFNAEAADLWCMDLRTGATVKWEKSKSRLLARCKEAAALYKILAGAMQAEI